jgi:N-acetylmuramoyl-L-alanine amidase
MTVAITGLLTGVPEAAAVDLSPVDGYHDLVGLSQGDRGLGVVRLQQRLTELAMYHGRITGSYDEGTAYAVRAFHAYLGLEPSYDFAALDWIRIDSMPATTGIPDRWNEPDRVEVDVGRQLMFIVRSQELVAIIPVSTGGGYVYYSELFGRDKLAWTPRGDFTLYWHQLGWSCLPACVYKYWGFTPYYGIHGYETVPNHPVSHGCIRVTVADARFVEPLLFIGMPMHVWDTPPAVRPQPPPFA